MSDQIQVSGNTVLTRDGSCRDDVTGAGRADLLSALVSSFSGLIRPDLGFGPNLLLLLLLSGTVSICNRVDYKCINQYKEGVQDKLLSWKFEKKI